MKDKKKKKGKIEKRGTRKERPWPSQYGGAITFCARESSNSLFCFRSLRCYIIHQLHIHLSGCKWPWKMTLPPPSSSPFFYFMFLNGRSRKLLEKGGGRWEKNKKKKRKMEKANALRSWHRMEEEEKLKVGRSPFAQRIHTAGRQAGTHLFGWRTSLLFIFWSCALRVYVTCSVVVPKMGKKDTATVFDTRPKRKIGKKKKKLSRLEFRCVLWVRSSLHFRIWMTGSREESAQGENCARTQFEIR